MQRIGQLPPFYRISLYVSVACGAIIILMMLRGIMLPGIDNSIADKDFVNYWMAGKLVFDGKLLDLFGPQPIYFSHLQAAFGEGFQWHNWSYPPHFLLLIWPLGLLGYKAAMVAFLVVTGGLYLVAYRAYVGGWSLLAWAATAPFLVLNLWCVQNGYLFGAIALGFMLLRDKRPIVSGVLLALLTIKPQLGLLFPFLLIAERRWLVIACTIASTALLVVLSAALFGIDSWRGYIDEVLPYQTLVAANLSGPFLGMLCSPFGALRNWGMDATTALWIHAIVAAPVALITILAFFKVPDTRHRANIFFTATFLITPYALNYDLGTFSATVAVMTMADAARKRQQQWRMVMYAMAMMLPILMMLLTPVRGSIAPFVIFAMWLVALNQAGFRVSMPRRQEAETPAAASS
jgi:hypothetical protein